MRLTDPVRTALDLARWAPGLTEKVAAVDALAFHCGVTVDAVRALARVHLGAHHTRGLPAVLALVNGLAESPRESRVRMAIVLGGLPSPVAQHPVSIDGRRYRLDLAYPELRLAIEYDGREHRGQLRAHADLLREADLTRLGWTVLRFDTDTTLWHPDHIAYEVRAERVLITGTATPGPSRRPSRHDPADHRRPEAPAARARSRHDPGAPTARPHAPCPPTPVMAR